ncbi:hypothetical protein TrST_g12511 [Triparma strigata]|uniref:TNFR-Cys domain-containing protein n=1 Tax=Triparma strigata TaxID=1606541 RepID=A0A9W7EMJ2_9STRA|nr:hypothetical protein TrST_g12511 [Triparma strigata]
MACSSCTAGKYLTNAATSVGSFACTDCGAGQYSGVAAATCSNCVAGRYLTNSAIGVEFSACSICAAGKYSGSPASTVCTICPAGKYNADQAMDASLHVSCQLCSPGSYLADNGVDVIRHNSADDCIQCGPGSYSNAEETQMASCEECPDGLNSPAGASFCSSCPPEYNCNDGKTAACDAGTYSNGDTCPGGTDHSPCRQGSYQPDPSQSTCLSCPPGKYQNVDGQDACVDCPSGYFCPERTVIPIACGSAALYCPLNSGIVQAIHEGYYSTGGTEITRHDEAICEAGFACNGGVKFSCGSNGQYADDLGLSGCKAAPAGKKPTANRQSIESCELGTASTGAQDECTPCNGDGQYADELGLSACKTAPAGKTPTANRQSIESCEAGTYFVGGANECSACGPGERSEEGAAGCSTCAVCEPGKYKISDCSSDTPTQCGDCLKGKASMGGEAANCTSCQNGKFSDVERASVCKTAPSGTRPTEGHDDFEPCPAGKYSVGDVDECST